MPSTSERPKKTEMPESDKKRARGRKKVKKPRVTKKMLKNAGIDDYNVFSTYPVFAVRQFPAVDGTGRGESTYTLSVLDPVTFKVVAKKRFSGKKTWLNSLKFSPDGKFALANVSSFRNSSTRSELWLLKTDDLSAVSAKMFPPYSLKSSSFFDGPTIVYVEEKDEKKTLCVADLTFDVVASFDLDSDTSVFYSPATGHVVFGDEWGGKTTVVDVRSLHTSSLRGEIVSTSADGLALTLNHDDNGERLTLVDLNDLSTVSEIVVGRPAMKYSDEPDTCFSSRLSSAVFDDRRRVAVTLRAVEGRRARKDSEVVVFDVGSGDVVLDKHVTFSGVKVSLTKDGKKVSIKVPWMKKKSYVL